METSGGCGFHSDILIHQGDDWMDSVELRLEPVTRCGTLVNVASINEVLASGERQNMGELWLDFVDTSCHWEVLHDRVWVF
jgi:hypothetical protein